MSNASNMDLAPQLSVEVVAVYEQADGQARVLHRTRRQAHSARERHVDYVWPLPNVLLGVTCEDQQRADERIPILLQYPAAVRWVSAEPQLTSIDFTEIALPDELAASARLSHACVNALTDQDDEHFFNVHAKLDWIVVGGETGEGRRECEITAIEDVARQCGAAGAPVFVKQDGGKYPGRQGRISDATWALKQFPSAQPTTRHSEEVAP